MAIEFKDVARALSCREFAEAEMEVNRAGRARCPFHGGTHGNLAFYDDGRCHCFKCGRTADVVQLAASVWHMEQREAAEELNSRFGLGLSSETVTPAERARRDQARQEARELREMVRRSEVEAWSRACDDERAAQAEIERFKIEDADKPEFNQALQRLCAAQLRCEVLAAARR